jgi:hypothetical protein
VNATARDFYGFTSAMSYARLLISACSKEPMPSGMTKKQLPPRYAATPLIQHYFNNIFVMLPIFEEASFYGSVDAVYHTERKASAFDHWTVRMVLALGCISSSDQRGDTHYLEAVGHINAALEYAEEVLHPGHISTIQAILLLVQYALMDPQHFDSWHLIGACSRLVVDIGLHQDPSKSSYISKSKLELRRRVFWAVYALDRYVKLRYPLSISISNQLCRSTSLVHARAFSFSDDSAHVSYPFNNQNTPAKSPPTTKAYMWLQSYDAALDLFKIRRIQSSWYTDLFQSGHDAWSDPYPYIWRRYSEMSTWFSNISSSTLPSTRSFFEIELLYSYVYLLSPSPRCPRITPYAKRLIFEHCIAYSTAMLALLNDASSPTTKTPLTFYDAMRSYMTASQFLDVISRNIDTILSPIPPTPPATSPPVVSASISAPHDIANVDPFSNPSQTASTDSKHPSNLNVSALPPPFPTPVIPPHDTTNPTSTTVAPDPTSRAIAAINDFTTILSRFGARFGNVAWRDKFQNDAAGLLHQLYARGSSSPMSSPSSGYAQPQMQGQYGHNPNQGHGGAVATQGGYDFNSSATMHPPLIPPPPVTANARAYDWGNHHQAAHSNGVNPGVEQYGMYAPPNPNTNANGVGVGGVGTGVRQGQTSPQQTPFMPPPTSSMGEFGQAAEWRS